MSFVLQGEINIDGRKGVVALKSIQREATRTSQSFDLAGKSTASLARSLLSINSQAAATSKALQLIGRTGGLGLFGAGLVKGGIALGDTLTNIAVEAEKSGKSIDRAFGAGLAATSAAGVQSAIESISSEIDRLTQKTEQFNLARTLGKGIEKLTGIDLGLAPEEGLISAGQASVKILESEKKRLETVQKLVNFQKQQSEIADLSRKDELLNSKILQAKNPSLAKFLSGKTEEISLAEQIRSSEAEALELLRQQDSELRKIANKEKDSEILAKSQNAITEQRLRLKQAELNLIKAETAERKRQQVETFGRGGEGAQFLLQGRVGGQALATARRRREIETTRQNFQLRESTLAELANKATAEEGVRISKQDIRKRLAAQQAAQELPSMAQRVMAEEARISPELMAAGTAAQKGGARATGPKEAFGGIFEALKTSIDNLSKKLPAAVPQ